MDISHIFPLSFFFWIAEPIAILTIIIAAILTIKIAVELTLAILLAIARKLNML